MSGRTTFTQAKIERAVKGAKKAGLRVVGIRVADGVVLVQDGDAPIAPFEAERQTEPTGNSWDDV